MGPRYRIIRSSFLFFVDILRTPYSASHIYTPYILVVTSRSISLVQIQVFPGYGHKQTTRLGMVRPGHDLCNRIVCLRKTPSIYTTRVRSNNCHSLSDKLS